MKETIFNSMGESKTEQQNIETLDMYRVVVVVVVVSSNSSSLFIFTFTYILDLNLRSSNLSKSLRIILIISQEVIQYKHKTTLTLMQIVRNSINTN